MPRTITGYQAGAMFEATDRRYDPGPGTPRGPAMNAFYEHHKDSIRLAYRCFDRILLNGLIQPFQQPERVVGFFNTYRHLYPVSRVSCCAASPSSFSAG